MQWILTDPDLYQSLAKSDATPAALTDVPGRYERVSVLTINTGPIPHGLLWKKKTHDNNSQ